jgi:type IV secretion system protein VirB6
MACQRVTTGQQFLAETLGHLDCQAQSLGSFGFTALAEPGSPASFVLTALLTLFIAIFALRLLFAGDVGRDDVVGGVLKIGIAATLALSWPAFRTLAYDTVLKGPAEIAGAMTNPNLPDTRSGFVQRLQNVDTGITSLTTMGTGRRSGSLELEGREDAFRSIALQDESGLAYARTLYLGSAIGSLAILRVTGGLLLALAPLFAGLLLFGFSRGLFAGWLRGLVLVALGSIGITVLLAVEVAVLEPWLLDAINRRNLGYATPNAPTELLALTLGFALAAAGVLFLLAKVAFQNGWPAAASLRFAERAGQSFSGQWGSGAGAAPITVQPRAIAVSEGVTAVMRRENLQLEGPSGSSRRYDGPHDNTGRQSPQTARDNFQPLGSSHRRDMRRTTSSQTRRDKNA